MKKIIAIVLCIIMAMSLTACNVQPRMGSGNIALARSESGGHELLLRDYLYFLAMIRIQNEQMLSQFFGMGWDQFDAHWSDPLDDTGTTMFTGLKEGALEDAIETLILYSVARERGYTYDRDMVAMFRDSIAQEVQSLNMPDRVGARVFYEFYYVTYAEMLDVYRMLLTAGALRESIFENISVSDADARAFYDNPANAEIIESQRSMTVAHILVTFDSEAADIDADRAEVTEIAESILARINAGESFASLVELYSEDPGSWDNEGQYVVTMNTSFVPEFLDWTLAAEIGDLGIVETGHGLHIMNLVDRDTFDDMMRERITTDGPLQPLTDALQFHFFQEELDNILATHRVDDWVIDTELFDSITHNVYNRIQR